MKEMTLEEALAYAKKEIDLYMYEGSLYHLSKKDFALKLIYKAYQELKNEDSDYECNESDLIRHEKTVLSKVINTGEFKF